MENKQKNTFIKEQKTKAPVTRRTITIPKTRTILREFWEFNVGESHFV